MARAGSDGAPLAFSCDCGTVTGHLTAEATASGVHAVCFCRDCRAAELWLARPDPAPGPVDVFQTTADKVRFDSGTDRIALMRLRPRGLMRWYAGCCGAPLFNTLARPQLAFASIHTGRLHEPGRTGPIRVRSFEPKGGGIKHSGWGSMVFRLLAAMLAARLSGRWRQTPFFDPDTGEPVVPATILDNQARAALYR